jgi:hypothetical protein
MNDDKAEPPDQSEKFKNAARDLGADEDEGRWTDRLKKLIGMGSGLTSSGYWAKLRAAGIAPVRRLPNSQNWMARNRAGENPVVRDPSDMTPDERADAADYYIGLYGE